MFDDLGMLPRHDVRPDSVRPGSAVSPDSRSLRTLVPALRHLGRAAPTVPQLDRSVAGQERLAQIRALEELKAAAAAAQARIAVAFEDAERDRARSELGGQTAPDQPHRARERDDQVPSDQQAAARRQRQHTASIAAQVAAARRESPHAGARFLRTARALVREMPCALTALESGRLSEYRASVVVSETACLSSQDRSRVDAAVCGDLARVSGFGNRQLRAEVTKAAYRAAPEVVTERAAYAVSERQVSLRPAPDTMVWLTALLPVAQGVSAYAALVRHANAARAAGDTRSRGQLLADGLVERLSGQADGTAVPVEVNLIMTDRTLLQGDHEPAHLLGYGTIPGNLARTLVSTSSTSRRGSAGFWLRRLYTHPSTGQLAVMDARSRFFPAGLAQLIRLRDQHCRTPWCDAPIRHIDHVQPYERGGPTSFENGQGLCEDCNLTKGAAIPAGSADNPRLMASGPPDPPGHGASTRQRSPALGLDQPPITLAGTAS
ncbi:MAG: HNH endonuclease [Nocardioides sp.]